MMCCCLHHSAGAVSGRSNLLVSLCHHPSQGLSSKSWRHLSAISHWKLHALRVDSFANLKHHPSKWFPRELLGPLLVTGVTFSESHNAHHQCVSSTSSHGSSWTLFCHPVSPGPPSPMRSDLSHDRIPSQLVASCVPGPTQEWQLLPICCLL